MFGIPASLVGLMPWGRTILSLIIGSKGTLVFLGIAGFMIWTAYTRHDARKEAWRACEARNNQATIELMEERIAAERKVIKKSQEAADKFRAENETLKQEVAKHVEEIAAVKDGACVLDDDFRRRLQTLRRR